MNQQREHRVAQARVLRAQGRVLREIADTLGVSLSTAARWSDPAFEERARQRSRQAKHARRVPCERCSRPLSYERAGGVCSRCLREQSHRRLERIAGLYEAGVGPPEIAAQVGLGEGHVRNLISKLARGGILTPRYAPRDRGSVREREQRLLTLSTLGATHAQMGEVLHLAPDSVNQALVRLRKRGELREAAAA